MSSSDPPEARPGATDQEAEVIQPGNVEPAPLLPGELPTAELPEDARHWAAVYEELTAFLLQVHPDLPEVVARYQRRLEHWRQLRDLLEQSGGFRGQSDT
jgi:hypothetical protein